MTKIEQMWTSFHVRYENIYKVLILELLQANMNAVADEAESKDADAQQIVDIANSVIDGTQIYLLLMSLYKRVGMMWGARLYNYSNREANIRTRPNESRMSTGFDHWSPAVARLRADKITRTQKRQVAQIVKNGVAAGKTNRELATSVRQNMYIKAHALIIARTETVTGGNRGAFEAAQASEYQQLKTWHSQEDYKVRDPNNPYYRTPPKYSHRNVNGNTVPIDQPFLNTYGYIMYPGDPDAALENTINCRCFMEITPVLDSQGRPVKKVAPSITVIQPRNDMPQNAEVIGDITVIQPAPDITVIRPGDIPNRQTITF